MSTIISKLSVVGFWVSRFINTMTMAFLVALFGLSLSYLVATPIFFGVMLLKVKVVVGILVSSAVFGFAFSVILTLFDFTKISAKAQNAIHN